MNRVKIKDRNEGHFSTHNDHSVYPMPSKHIKASPYRPISETPLEWRFADWPIVAGDCLLAGLFHATVNGNSIFIYNTTESSGTFLCTDMSHCLIKHLYLIVTNLSEKDLYSALRDNVHFRMVTCEKLMLPIS